MEESATQPFCHTCGVRLRADSPSGVCPRCLFEQAMAPTEPLEGAQRYEVPTVAEIQEAFPELEIVELIGRGGMGAVFKARQPKLARQVALKILPQELASRSGFRERFEREARALAALDHPNIVTIHDFGRSSVHADEGYYFLLMEYVDGIHLRDLLHSRQFTAEEGLAIVPPICEALEFAHAQGIVHRDIKPENLLLDKDGRVKIADFGIATMLDSERDKQSWSEPSLGTPRYMAPEQGNESENPDHRVDIYALGVVIYELLTGEAPTQSLQPVAKRAGVDVRIDSVVRRALEKDPALRFQTVTELKTMLESIQEPETLNLESEPSPFAAITCLILGGLTLGLVAFLARHPPAVMAVNQEIGMALVWVWVLQRLLLITLSILVLLIGSALAWQHFEWLCIQRKAQRRHVGKTIVAVLVVPLVVVAGLLAVSQGPLAVIMVVLGGVWAVHLLRCRLDEGPRSSVKLGVGAALRRYRWCAWFITIIGGAVITPTSDVPTLALLVLPVIVLYELIQWVALQSGRRIAELEEVDDKKAIGRSVTVHAYAVFFSLFTLLVVMAVELDESEYKVMHQIASEAHTYDELTTLQVELDEIRARDDLIRIGCGVLVAGCMLLWLVAPLSVWNRLKWSRSKPERKPIVLATAVSLGMLCLLIVLLASTPRYERMLQSSVVFSLCVTLLGYCVVGFRWLKGLSNGAPLRATRWQQIGGISFLGFAAITVSASLLEREANSLAQSRLQWESEFRSPGPDYAAEIRARLEGLKTKLDHVAAAMLAAENDPEMTQRLEYKKAAFEQQATNAESKLKRAESVLKRQARPRAALSHVDWPDWKRERALFALAGLLALSGWLVYLWRPQRLHEV